MPPPEGALRGEAREQDGVGERRARPRAGAGAQRISPWDWASRPLSSLPVPLPILQVLALQGGSLPKPDEPPADPQECIT